MVLKRKRSLSELCASPLSTTSSASSNFSFQSPPPRYGVVMDMSSRASLAAPAHLDSRTMKRSRDNRPTEEEVHRRTLDVLFAAQRPHHNNLPQQMRPAASTSQEQVQSPPATVQQTSLHRFWNIGSAQPPAKSVPPIPQWSSAPTNCEDCGMTLGSGDDMELDNSESDGISACGACGKNVCFGCSVRNLGEDKRCLQCAGRKVWVGGIGWTNSDVSVC